MAWFILIASHHLEKLASCKKMSKLTLYNLRMKWTDSTIQLILTPPRCAATENQALGVSRIKARAWLFGALRAASAVDVFVHHLIRINIEIPS